MRDKWFHILLYQNGLWMYMLKSYKYTYMPGVARGDSVDTVAVDHGTGVACLSATTQSTDVCSGNVFVNKIGVVRKGDAMISHPSAGCPPHAPGLSTHSPNVFANKKQIGRLGDLYTGGHVISSASGNVFANHPL